MSESRDRLVSAGVTLLERDGLAALTLRRIATAAGVSHGAPRHHFPTYAGLLAAIARTGIDDLGAELARAWQEPGDQALRTAAHTYLDFARRRPEMFELIVRHDLLAGAGGDLRSITGQWFVRLVELVGDTDRALAIWSGVHGLAVLTNRRTTEPLTTLDSEAVLDVLLGLA